MMTRVDVVMGGSGDGRNARSAYPCPDVQVGDELTARHGRGQWHALVTAVRPGGWLVLDLDMSGAGER